MTTSPAFSVVDADTLPEYPISVHDRLDSHFFMQWNMKRWRGSTFRKRAYADPEVGWFGFELFTKAQDETPVGTLPIDEIELAFMLHMPLERWRGLVRRDLSPLHGWYPVRCDNGEIRYGHAVVIEQVEAAMKSKRAAAESAAQRRDAKRLKDLREKIEGIGASAVLRQANVLDRVDQWLTDNHSGNRTEAAVRRALDAVLS